MRKQATFMHAPRTSRGGYEDAEEGRGEREKKVAKDEGDDVSVLRRMGAEKITWE